MKRILITISFLLWFTFSFCQRNFTLNELENITFLDIKQVELYISELNNRTKNAYSTIDSGYIYPKTFSNNIGESIVKFEDFSIAYSFKNKEWHDQLLSKIRKEPYYKEKVVINEDQYAFISERFQIVISKSFDYDKKYTMHVYIMQGFMPLPTTKEFIPAKHIGNNTYEVNSFTNITDIFVSKDQSIRINASGIILFGSSAGIGGIDGIDGYTEHNRIRGFKHGSLLVRISDGDWIKVKNGMMIVAKKAGVLQFLVNDKVHLKNSGSFQVI
ncbi:MAG: hypothetical protein WCP74_03815 [Sphingobacteriia bacterium]|jgi:hypothetical protein